MDEAQGTPAPARPRRPTGVIIVTIGLVLTGLSSYLVAATALTRGTTPWGDVPVLGETNSVVRLSPMPPQVVAAAAIAVGSLALVVSVGFFLLRSWGWTGLMLLAAVSLTINLVAVVVGDPNEGSMAVAIAAVLYANQRRIQLLFRGRQVTVFEPTGTDVRPVG